MDGTDIFWIFVGGCFLHAKIIKDVNACFSRTEGIQENFDEKLYDFKRKLDELEGKADELVWDFKKETKELRESVIVLENRIDQINEESETLNDKIFDLKKHIDNIELEIDQRLSKVNNRQQCVGSYYELDSDF